MKIGRVNQDPKEVAANVAEAIPQMVAYIGCWEDFGFEKVN
jgi:hypothetical protein